MDDNYTLFEPKFRDKIFYKLEEKSPSEGVIPDEHKSMIRGWAKKIRPVMRFAQGSKGLFEHPDGYLYYIKPCDLFNEQYLRNPEPTKPVKIRLEALGPHMLVYHEKKTPTIGEVLQAIPHGFLKKTILFEKVADGEPTPNYEISYIQLYAKKKIVKKLLTDVWRFISKKPILGHVTIADIFVMTGFLVVALCAVMTMFAVLLKLIALITKFFT